jgi:transposase
MTSNAHDPHDEMHDQHEARTEQDMLAAQDARLAPADSTAAPAAQAEQQQPVDYLQLPGLRTLAEPIKGKTRLLVRVEQLLPTVCPNCGQTGQLTGNGTRRQFLFDEPRGSFCVRLDLRRRSYYCGACDKSKLVPLTCIAKGRRMTERLERFIQRKSLLRPFLEVAQETGVSAKTVRKIFHEHVAVLENERMAHCPTPRVLGLDGVYIKSKERAILTDPVRGLVIDLWPTVRADLLAAALRYWPGRTRVEVVTMDMSAALRKAVRDALPYVTIVIDRYHIQRMANEAMDRVRHRIATEIKLTRGGLQMCPRKLVRKHRYQLSPEEREDQQDYFRLLPELALAYETKEGFFAIWREADKAKAEERPADRAAAEALYEAWRAGCPPELSRDFKPLLTAMANWGEYIFNYFDYPHTNAFTEASNRRIKDIQREGRGGSFVMVRAKAIFGTLVRQELKAAREQEPGYVRRRGTTRSKAKRRQRVEAGADRARPYRLPAGLQLSLF